MTSPTLSPDEFREQVGRLRALAGQAANEGEARQVISRIAQISRTFRVQNGVGLPATPLEQAQQVDKEYVSRPHLDYLSDRIAQAVRDVERGQNRHLAISMPPRAGKSRLTSFFTPLWMLRRHPEWKIMMTSYDSSLTTGWAREIRNTVEDHPDLGIALQRDGGAGGSWSTMEGGGMLASAVRGGALTGRGARVLIIDDPVKDFGEAHSPRIRQDMWDWWLSVAQTRLEQPYLVIVCQTRWHEDDFLGRILSDDYEGNPNTWENISLPAFAGSDDTIGRQPGEPLLSPLMPPDPEAATKMWEQRKEAVGTYVFSAMFQQRPAPAQGAIFDAGWWRFWTFDQSKATDDGRVVYLDPSSVTGGKWLDSWDCAFKGGVGTGDSSGRTDYVVGQRWVRQGANRYLVAQQRGRWSFTQTIERMKEWAVRDDPRASPCGHLVNQRVIEDKANGPAIIDVLRETIPGLKPINPNTSKEARARAVTPEVESGNTFLPHPGDPGNEWVYDLLSELRNFPHDMHDDQVDTLTQALGELRDEGRGGVTVPGGRVGGPRTINRNVSAAAQSSMRGIRRY